MAHKDCVVSRAKLYNSRPKLDRTNDPEDAARDALLICTGHAEGIFIFVPIIDERVVDNLLPKVLDFEANAEAVLIVLAEPCDLRLEVHVCPSLVHCL